MKAILWLLAVLFMVATLALGAAPVPTDDTDDGTRTIYYPGDE